MSRGNKGDAWMKKKEYIIALIAFILVAAVVGTLAFFGGKHSPSTGSTETSGDAKTEKWQEGVIEYNGKHYKYNNIYCCKIYNHCF